MHTVSVCIEINTKDLNLGKPVIFRACKTLKLPIVPRVGDYIECLDASSEVGFMEKVSNVYLFQNDSVVYVEIIVEPGNRDREYIQRFLSACSINEWKEEVFK